MATQTALIIVAGRTQRITSTDDLGVGSGITALGNTNLTLSAGGTATDVIIAANKNLVGGTGTGSVDFSNMSGTFDTPTGAAVFNGSTNTFTNVIYADGDIDSSPASIGGGSTLRLGANYASGVEIGAVGINTTIKGDLTVNGNEVVVGTSTFDDDVTFGDGIGTDTVTFRSTIQGFGAGLPILSTGDNTVQFGSTANRYSQMHATTLYARADATNTSFSTLTATGLTGTAAGAFTVASGAGQVLTLNGANGLNIQGGGSTALAVNSTGTTMTIQSGVTLTTTGTGTIDLPANNGTSHFFKIEGTAVGATGGANITAANFDKLFDGSTVTTHTHAGLAAGSVVVTGLTTTGLAVGDAAYVSANNTVSKASGLSAAAAVFFGVVSATGSAKVAGVATTACTAGGAPGAGVPVYLSVATPGVVTAVAPSTATQFVSEVGVCLDNTNYPTTIEMLISPKTVVAL